MNSIPDPPTGAPTRAMVFSVATSGFASSKTRTRRAASRASATSVATHAETDVACAAPATPHFRMNGPLRPQFSKTVANEIWSAARVSPRPLNPAKAAASAQSGSAPQRAVAARYLRASTR